MRSRSWPRSTATAPTPRSTGGLTPSARAGSADDALRSIATLRSSYPRSRWIKDAAALELEVRQASGQSPAVPEKDGDDLKLLALGGLMQADPSRAMPIIVQMLSGPSPDTVKDRALFVLAQSASPEARAALLNIARNDGDPALQAKGVHYLGLFGGTESRQALLDVYAAAKNPEVRKAVLNGLMIAGDRGRLAEIARTDQSPELRHEATKLLGVAGGKAELAQLYKQQTGTEDRRAALMGLFVAGAVEQVTALAQSETDPELRAEAIQQLGLMGPTTAPTLKAIFAAEKSPEAPQGRRSRVLRAEQCHRTRRDRTAGEGPRGQARRRADAFPDADEGSHRLHAGAAQMKMRRLFVACACSMLVPVVNMSGSLSPVVAAPFVAVEAPSDAPDRQDGLASGTPVPVVTSRLERRDGSAGLSAAAKRVMASSAGPAWLAWTVRVVGQGHTQRVEAPREVECVLDDEGHLGRGSSTTGDTTSIVVLVRFAARAIDRVTFTDARCVVQAGARPVYWMDGASPKDSVGLLAEVVERRVDDARHVRQGALAALALTDDRSADAALERFVETTRPAELRRDAAFWLGAARGAAGARVVNRLLTTDRDVPFREHLTFVLSLTGPTGLDRLIDLARHDSEPGVRRQALFWLSQKAGERAAGTIAAAADDDPDIEVRKQAVFAMSQLPNGEGVPTLLALARTHRDREVRKQAMFWLGQSGDPRALALFEQVLKP